MSREVVKVGVELDRETDLTYRGWSKDWGRSKRRHVSVQCRRLANLRRMSSDDLMKLTTFDLLQRLELLRVA